MTANRLLVAGVAAVILAVLGGIAYTVWYEANDPGHGTITGKTHRPATTTTRCTTTGKTTTCIPNTTPECYQVRYTDGKHDGDECVSREAYDRYAVGGQYP